MKNPFKLPSGRALKRLSALFAALTIISAAACTAIHREPAPGAADYLSYRDKLAQALAGYVGEVTDGAIGALKAEADSEHPGLNECSQIVIIGEDGKRLYAMNGEYITADSGLELAVEPYGKYAEYQTYASENSASGMRCRLAYIMKDGEPLCSIRLGLPNADATGNFAKAFDPSRYEAKYADLFGQLSETQAALLFLVPGSYAGAEYRSHQYPIAAGPGRLSGDDIRSLLNSLVSDEDAEAIANYVDWEYSQLEAAVGGCADFVSMPGAKAFALVFYPLQTRYSASWSGVDPLNVMIAVFCASYVAFALALAAWVFADARRRDFKPALWGALTIAGSVLILAAYLMTRPETPVAPVCHSCGATVKREQLFCPYCGQRLTDARACQTCKRKLDKDYAFCPYCGKEAK